MRLTLLSQSFAVCKLSRIPAHGECGKIFFLAKTENEISLVCEESRAPNDANQIKRGWRAFEVEGPLDFGLTGILAGIASALAKAGVSIFSVSTYDTDYVLVKEEIRRLTLYPDELISRGLQPTTKRK